MVPIGIIFYVCLAFALAILLLISCCICKVSKKDPGDVEMFKSDLTNGLQTTCNKNANDNVPSSHNHNVILFLNKKDKYHNEKHDTINYKQNIDDVDNDYKIDLSNINDDNRTNQITPNVVESSHQYHGNQGYHSSGNHQPVQSTSHTSQSSDSHGFHSHNHSHSPHDYGLSNGGFSSGHNGHQSNDRGPNDGVDGGGDDGGG